MEFSPRRFLKDVTAITAIGAACVGAWELGKADSNNDASQGVDCAEPVYDKNIGSAFYAEEGHLVFDSQVGLLPAQRYPVGGPDVPPLPGDPGVPANQDGTSGGCLEEF